MKRFHDKVFAMTQKGLLLWEPSWETFRPVDSVVWNPINNQLEPYFGVYTHDIFDVHYGFGTSAMHDFCIAFTDDNAYDVNNAEEIESIEDFWRWSKTGLSWVMDRGMRVHPCAGDPQRKQYLLRYRLRAKSCKRPPRNLNGTRKVHTH